MTSAIKTKNSQQNNIASTHLYVFFSVLKKKQDLKDDFYKNCSIVMIFLVG